MQALEKQQDFCRGASLENKSQQSLISQARRIILQARKKQGHAERCVSSSRRGDSEDKQTSRLKLVKLRHGTMTFLNCPEFYQLLRWIDDFDHGLFGSDISAMYLASMSRSAFVKSSAFDTDSKLSQARIKSTTAFRVPVSDMN